MIKNKCFYDFYINFALRTPFLQTAHARRYDDMKSITLLDKTFKIFIENEKIEEAIDRVAERLNRDCSGFREPPVLLCILNGSIMFTAELMKRLSFNCELVTMKLSSYDGTSSTGSVRQVIGISGNITGRQVIIVEDIVDTGNTIADLTEFVRKEGASGCIICTMLLKPEVYHKDIRIDHVAMEIPNRFIVGFGLDYNGLGRNLKDIYVLDE